MMENASAQKYTIATVVKRDPHPWFNRMRVGVEQFKRDSGHHTIFAGPPQFDGMLQAKTIEEVLEHSVDALCVISFFPQALERILGKARRQGIVVITNEATNQRNNDYNLEPFDNAAFGARLLDTLARYMGEEGEYVMFVESLATKAHVEWMEGALARQQAKYPRMNLVAGKIEHQGEEPIACAKTKKLFKTFPHLKGILAFGMPGPPGAARAAEEEGLQDQISIVGNSLVSVSRPYLERDTIKLIGFWDPADHGYVLNTLAVKVLRGEPITDGMDLGVPGYTHIQKHEKLLAGAAWIEAAKDNMQKYDF